MYIGVLLTLVHTGVYLDAEDRKGHTAQKWAKNVGMLRLLTVLRSYRGVEIESVKI